jgi:hypothetical protein
MLFDEHSLGDLLRSLEGEIAKTMNEVTHAQQDLDKAMNRQKFILALIHHLKQRI